jgi:hypothetical protein
MTEEGSWLWMWEGNTSGESYFFEYMLGRESERGAGGRREKVGISSITMGMRMKDGFVSE